MYGKIQQHLQNELNTIEQNGIFKKKELLHLHKEQKLQLMAKRF